MTGKRACAALLLAAGCALWDPLDQPGLRVMLSPVDTALYVDASMMVRGEMVNSFFDVYPSEDIRYRGLDSTISVTSNGRVTGVSYGRGRIVAYREQLADTGFVTVVPQGTLALSSFSALDVMNIDGSGYSSVTSVGQGLEEAVAWVPSRDSIVYPFGIPGGAGAADLYVTDLAGNHRQLLTNAHDPRVTRDRTWVYFTSQSLTGPNRIERAHLDGTARETVVLATVAHPDPSPDGTELAFIHLTPPPTQVWEIRIRRLSDSTDRVLTSDGQRPRWSPDGSRIAFWRAETGGVWGAIYVMNPDSSNLQRISPPGRSYRATVLDWSPDAQWLVARGEQTLELIQVSTGLTLPLGYAMSYPAATWRW